MILQCQHFFDDRYDTDTEAPPATETKTKPGGDVQDEDETFQSPMYNVILLDDDDHSYDYVIEMLGDIFGHPFPTAYNMACEVDRSGRVIVETTHLERAEMKRDQIHGYGADWRIPRCKGSMSAEIEPVSD